MPAAPLCSCCLRCGTPAGREAGRWVSVPAAMSRFLPARHRARLQSLLWPERYAMTGQAWPCGLGVRSAAGHMQEALRWHSHIRSRLHFNLMSCLLAHIQGAYRTPGPGADSCSARLGAMANLFFPYYGCAVSRSAGRAPRLMPKGVLDYLVTKLSFLHRSVGPTACSRRASRPVLLVESL